MLRSSIGLLLAVILLAGAGSVQASDLSTLLGNGARWHLTLDDWDGELVISHAEINSSDPAETVLTARVSWLHIGGTLEAREYPGDMRRSIELILATPDGHRFKAEGMLGRETDRFMAGETQYTGDDAGYFGAWYATSLAEGAPATRMMTPNTTVKSFALPAVKGAATSAAGTCTIEGRIGGPLDLVGIVSVTPSSETGGSPLGVQVSANGSYRATGLAPGNYRVTVQPTAGVHFRGAGIDQAVNCGPGKTVHLQTKIGVRE